MKKEMQQTRVNSGLCFLKYLGNSSDTEVTMVSMVANWNKVEKKASERAEKRKVNSFTVKSCMKKGI